MRRRIRQQSSGGCRAAGATPPDGAHLARVLAWDRRLPGDLLATAEALYTRNLSDFIFVNLNLMGPQSVDRYGRTLYGTFDALGRASPIFRAPIRDFPGVIDLQNVSANHWIQLSARLEKRFSAGLAADGRLRPGPECGTCRRRSG